jgi:hypothetical protein
VSTTRGALVLWLGPAQNDAAARRWKTVDRVPSLDGTAIAKKSGTAALLRHILARLFLRRG